MVLTVYIAPGLSGRLWHIWIQKPDQLHRDLHCVQLCLTRQKYQANLTLSTSAMGKQTLLSPIRNLVCGRTCVKTCLKPLFIVCLKQTDHMILCLNKVLQGEFGKASFFLLILIYIFFLYLVKQTKKCIIFLNLLLCKGPERVVLAYCTSKTVHFV